MSTDPRPRRRTPAIAIGLIAVAALIALAALLLLARGDGGGPDLNAQAISPSREAPPTAGTGHDGTPVSIPVQGRPALVTFLFSSCPDICLTISRTIRTALDRAGPGADDLDVVAISVDPEGDTPAAVAAFLDTHGLTGRMRYIVGTRAELEPLWSAWMIAAQPPGQPNSAHSARIVLIDRDGRQVGSYAAGIAVDPDDLAADLTALTAG